MELIQITILLIVSIVTLTEHVFSLHLNSRVKRLVDAPADIYDNIRYDAYLKIYKNPPSSCTGSIINEEFILTAAHCVVYPRTRQIITEKIEVRTAVTNLVGENHIVGRVEKVYVPSMYYSDPDFPSRSKGDIALLKLNCKLGLKNIYKFQKLTLPSEQTDSLNINQHADKLYIFSGFGVVDVKLRGNIINGKAVYDKKSASELHYGISWVLDDKYCNVIDHYYQFCAIIKNRGYHPGGGVCSGDSGGALVDPVALPNNITAIGIANYGRGDCVEDWQHPTVYTRVSSFLDFIHKAQADKRKYRDIHGFDTDIRTHTYHLVDEFSNYKGKLCPIHKRLF